MSILGDTKNERLALSTCHYLAPLCIIIVYSVASLISLILSGHKAVENAKTKPENEKKKKDTVVDDPEIRARRFVIALTVGVVLSYLVESALLIGTASSHQLTEPDDAIVSDLYRLLVWAILYGGLASSGATDAWYPYYSSWAVDLVFDLIIFGLDFTSTRLSRGVRIAQVIVQIVRICLVFALLGLKTAFRLYLSRAKASDEEVAPLLAHDGGASDAAMVGVNGYGGTQIANDSQAVNQSNNQCQPTENADNAEEEEEEEDRRGRSYGRMKKHWWLYAKSFVIFLPYLWPTKNLRLQLHFIGIAFCLVATRFLNVLIPLQVGAIVNALANGSNHVPWEPIVIFILMRLLTSSGGVDMLQTYLWLPVEKNSLQTLSCASYDHVMSLSSDFHTNKKSGTMWQTMQRGQSIVGLVQILSFELGPMLIDLVVAIGVFYWLFDAYMAFIGAAICVLVLYSTRKTLSKKTEGQRKFIKLWEAAYEQMTESSLNWMTVSYFNRINYEKERFKAAVQAEKTSWIYYRMLVYALGALRSFLLLIGLLAATLLAAAQIKLGGKEVGSFVTLMTYWAQLAAPLSYFASGFGRIAEELVDAEKLLDLMEKVPTIKNKENAKPFDLKSGEVEFSDVKFSYDGQREVLKSVSFHGHPGQTVALVGETGGGKSTILKLLFRFYDVGEGSIKIDGQDIRQVTLESLRDHIGVVPQDAVLFNQSIMNNLKYSNLEATDDQCKAACKAVALHDKIVSFSKGYNTTVGERGVKMSGGELQRMAIARVILKDPKIILLDEATSSVDSETEATIQASLAKVTKGRTTFVIAHRLSTIINADLVLVIKAGVIAEQGTHGELLDAKGHYYKLWSHQIKLSTGDSSEESKSPTKSTAPIFVDDLNALKIPSTQEHSDTTNINGSKPETEVYEPQMSQESLQSKHSAEGHNAHQSSHKARSRSRSPAKNIKFKLGGSGKQELKPNAPEFIPQGMKSDVSANHQKASSNGDPLQQEGSSVSDPAESSLSPPSDMEASNTDRHKENATTSEGTSVPSKRSRHGKWKKQNNNSTIGEHGSGSNSDRQLATSVKRQNTVDSPSLHEAKETTIEWAQEVGDEASTKPKRKRNIFNPRRKDSKSEPAGNKPGTSQMDGTEDDSTYYVSDEMSTSNTSNGSKRRVSAPGDPPPKHAHASRGQKGRSEKHQSSCNHLTSSETSLAATSSEENSGNGSEGVVAPAPGPAKRVSENENAPNGN